MVSIVGRVFLLVSIAASVGFGVRMLPPQDFPLVRYFCWNQSNQRYQYVMFEECHGLSPRPRDIQCWDEATDTFRLPYFGNMCPVLAAEQAPTNSGTFQKPAMFFVQPSNAVPKGDDAQVDRNSEKPKVHVTVPFVVDRPDNSDKESQGLQSVEDNNKKHVSVPLIVTLNTNNNNKPATGSNEFKFPFQRLNSPENRYYNIPSDYRINYNRGNIHNNRPLYHTANFRVPSVRYYGQVIRANTGNDSYALPYEVTHDHTISPIANRYSSFNIRRSETPPFKIQMQ